jgi:hypothetical protein
MSAEENYLEREQNYSEYNENEYNENEYNENEYDENEYIRPMRFNNADDNYVIITDMCIPDGCYENNQVIYLTSTEPSAYDFTSFKFPNKLNMLRIMLRKNIEFLKLPESVHTLDISVEPVKLTRLPESLRVLIIGCISMYDVSIIEVKFPQNLYSLKIEHMFDQSINSIILPESLRELMLDDAMFNQKIDNVNFPSQLIKIAFGMTFNQNIDTLYILPLKHLILGYSFNRQLHHLPLSLIRLKIGAMFSYINTVIWPTLCILELYCNKVNIDLLPKNLHILHLSHISSINLMMFISLRILSFKEAYDVDISELLIPQNVHTIICGHYFNKPINCITWPRALNRLEFGCHFNQDINELNNVVNLATLILGTYFNQPIQHLNSIQELTLGYNYTQDVTFINNCPNLITITFGKHPISLTNIFFHVIDTIYDYSHTITTSSSKWPTSLRQIIYTSSCKNSIIHYKRHVGQFTKAAH